jgi:hypothetical protein
MRLVPILFLFAACVISHHPTPTVHRTTEQACATSGGDTNGADECTVDTDCSGGGVCSCAGNTFEYAHETRNLCVPANCRTDADCGAYMCSPSDSSGGPFYGVQGYYCHTAHDTCTVDSECVQNGQQGYCMFAPEVGYWSCAYSFAAG